MLPSPDYIRRHLLVALAAYWRFSPEQVAALPIPLRPVPAPSQEPLPPRLVTIRLPDWAADLEAEGGLPVPEHRVEPGQSETWRRVDWWSTIFWYLQGLAERAWEARHGPVHSYAWRLRGFDPRLWQRAWVNRMALFLRRWAAREHGARARDLFGPGPLAQIILTHDVDAVTKTGAVRVKQTAFHLLNAVRFLRQARPAEAGGKLGQAARFLLRRADYWRFEEYVDLERRAGLTSHFNFYAGPAGWRRPWPHLLLDPGYDISHPRLREIIQRLDALGFTVGLHPSYDSWGSAEVIQQERAKLEAVLGHRVEACRQHWLRFSWERTWKAQEAAGLRRDFSLGFNETPGFRNGAALCFQPYDPQEGRFLSLEAVPLVLMDSHLHDYAPGPDERRRTGYWVDEIRAVGGTASIVWHQRVLSEDYGWGHGYRELLLRIKSDARSGDKAPREGDLS